MLNPYGSKRPSHVDEIEEGDETDICADCGDAYVYEGACYPDLCPVCDAYARAEDLAEERLSGGY